MEAASKAGWSSRSSRPRACNRRPSRCTKLGWRAGRSAATSAGRERGMWGRAARRRPTEALPSHTTSRAASAATWPPKAR
eukprot:14335077-Alexandrium_andersonii.AAC.1